MEGGEPRKGRRDYQEGRAEVEESRGVLRVRIPRPDGIVSRAMRLLWTFSLDAKSPGRRFRVPVYASPNSFTFSATSSACSAALTLGQMYLIMPDLSIRKVILLADPYSLSTP